VSETLTCECGHLPYPDHMSGGRVGRCFHVERKHTFEGTFASPCRCMGYAPDLDEMELEEDLEYEQ